MRWKDDGLDFKSGCRGGIYSFLDMKKSHRHQRDDIVNPVGDIIGTEDDIAAQPQTTSSVKTMTQER